MKKFLLLAFLCWMLIHVCRYYHRPIPILNDYLTDLLVVPVISCLCIAATRLWIVRRQDYVYPYWYYVFIAAYVSVVFEGILPLCSKAYTADWGDVGAYFAGAGACIFWTLTSRSAPGSRVKVKQTQW